MESLHGKKIVSESETIAGIKIDVLDMVENREVLIPLLGKWVQYDKCIIMTVSDRRKQRNYLLDKIDDGYIFTEIRIKQLTDNQSK